MGRTNLRCALERKYALLAGELADKAAQMARIERLSECLPALYDRRLRLQHLMECAAELLKEGDPDWSPDAIRPLKPNVHKAPVALGRISKAALDVLRESAIPLTSRAIADRLLAQESFGEVDSETTQRVVNSVDATLRHKVSKGVVVHDGGWPKRWSVKGRW